MYVKRMTVDYFVNIQLENYSKQNIFLHDQHLLRYCLISWLFSF